MKTPFFQILILFILSFSACNTNTPKSPENLIPQEKFTQLLAEFQLIQSTMNVYNDTLLAVQMRDSILKYYTISLDDFYASENYYHNDVNSYQDMLNKALDLLNEEQTRLLTASSESSDSVKTSEKQPKINRKR